MFKTLVVLSALVLASSQQDLSSITDLQTLSEIPLDKLLKLKNNFEIDENVDELPLPTIEDRSDNPEALALHSKFAPYRRGGHDHGGGGGGGYGGQQMQKKDLNSIFQMSVTALAFLAFGGYLLCLIVQAINAKQNSTMTMMGNPEMMAMFIRPSRIKNIQKRRPRPGNNRYKRGVEFDESMYDALISVAEGYTKYHVLDYKNLNSTYNYDNFFETA